MSQSALIFENIVVHIVRFRADGDVSFLGALARKIIGRGGRIASRIGRDCTHIIFQEKPCCSASEKASEEAKLRELFDKLDKSTQIDTEAPHVVSPLWVQESLKIGRVAEELEFVVQRPSAAAIWLHGASTSSSDPSASSKLIPPRRKSTSSATATAAALLSTSTLAPAPLAALLMDDMNEMLMFSSSQAIREADGGGGGIRIRDDKRIDDRAANKGLHHPPPPPKWADQSLKLPSKAEDPKPCHLTSSTASEREEDALGSRKRTREDQPHPYVNNSSRRSSLATAGPSNVSALLARALSSVVSPPLSAGGDAKKRRTSSNQVTPRNTPLNSPRPASAIIIPKVKSLDPQVIDLTLTGSKNDKPSSLETEKEIDKEEGVDNKENKAVLDHGGVSKAVTRVVVAAQKPSKEKFRAPNQVKMTDFFPLSNQSKSSKASPPQPVRPPQIETNIHLAYSSIDPQTVELVRSSSEKLKRLGADICSEGQEEGKITHLIIGPEPKRTIKLLVAIAEGCCFLTPQWISDSLNAGHFLEIDAYRSASNYSKASDAVRLRRENGGGRVLILEGQSVFLWPSRDDASKSKVKEKHRVGIERIVRLLGGKLTSSPSPAHTCIQMAGSEGEPMDQTQGVKWVMEEWLLQMAERQEPMKIEGYYVR